MLKKLILSLTGIALAAPVLADDWHRGHAYGHEKRFVVHQRYVVQRPAVVYQYYRPAPRPVYVVRQAPPPPPVIVHSHSNAGPALIVGAILGAAVVHSVMTGY